MQTEVYLKGIEENRAACTGCGACVNICKKDAIHMQMENGFLYPIINRETCISCGRCREICPVNKLQTLKPDNLLEGPYAYAARAINESVLWDSSSGGVFSILAERILNTGGVVFGVRFNSEFQTEHDCVRTKGSLFYLRQSKYVQSDMKLMMRSAKWYLDSGKNVLFSGTPCQIAGLKSFLGSDYDNLLCVDLSCHGVPSPIVWKKYLQNRCEKANSFPVEVNMRYKQKNSSRSFIKITYKNGKEYIQSHKKDPYMNCFTGDICLRESCYYCQYKQSLYKGADLTLGDFLGIEKQSIGLDGSNISLILVHSKKGMEILNTCKHEMLLLQAI